MLPWGCQYTVIILKNSSPKSNILKHFLKHFFFYNDAFEYLINVNSKQTPFVSQFIVKPVQNSFITSCQGSSKLSWKPVVLLLFSRLVFYIFYHLQIYIFFIIYSRGQHLCKFIGTKESVFIRKEFNSHRTGLGHHHGRRFIVLGHQYGRHDVM